MAKKDIKNELASNLRTGILVGVAFITVCALADFLSKTWPLTVPLMDALLSYLQSKWTGIVQTLILLVVFALLAISLSVQILFPVDDNWRPGYFMRTLSYLIGLVFFGRQPRFARGFDGKLERLSKVHSPGASGLVWIDAVSVGIVQRHNRFSHVIGPGFHILNGSESLMAVLDLRKQNYNRNIKFNTREGIELTTNVIIGFEIVRSADVQIQQGLFPFTAEAVRSAIYYKASQGNQPDSETPRYNWSEILASLAVEQFLSVVSQYSLDQLLVVDDPDQNPRNAISAQMLENLKPKFLLRGANLEWVSVGNFELPEAVHQQSLMTWRSTWQQRQEIDAGVGKSAANRQQENVRALSQVEMLQNLTQVLGDQADVQVVLMRFLESLEQAAGDSPKPQKPLNP